VCFASVIINALGLFGISKFVTGPESINTGNLFSFSNLHLFFFVFLVGVGYVLISQAATVWVKVLFPEENPLSANVDLNNDGAVNNDDVIALMWYILFPEENPL
jgi:hypothetical protein